MDKKIYLIGNAHIDPVWQWRFQDGISEILATMRSVLDRMKEFDDFKFTTAAVGYLEIIKNVAPEMFEEIKVRVKEKRFVIAGGWLVQPDCNLPDGEAFARTGLYSQNFLLENFGITAKTGYNVDSFGHNGNIPQILKKSEMNSYVFMRPCKTEKEMKADFFVWESLDGSKVNTYRLPFSYCNITWEKMLEAEKYSLAKGNKAVFYGVGNHGGGPTVKLINEIKENIKDKPEYIFSDIDEFFDDNEKEFKEKYQGELQYHARGAYSACFEIKKNNRLLENRLMEADYATLLCESLTGVKADYSKLDEAWKTLLFNQFHDLLGGCIVKSAYNDAMEMYGYGLTVSEQNIYYSLKRIAMQIDTLKGYNPSTSREYTIFPFVHEVLGSPIVLFNPLGVTIKKEVIIYEKCNKVLDDEGNSVPFQIVRGEQTDCTENLYSTSILAEVPAYGYKVIRIFRGEQPALTSTISASDNYISNGLTRVDFSGDVIKITNLESGKVITSGKVGGYLLDESCSDTWAHDNAKLGVYERDFVLKELKLVELGEVKGVIKATFETNGQTLTEFFTLYLGDKTLHVKTAINVNEKHKTVKLYIPAVGDEVFTEIPFAYTVRPNDDTEFPTGKWITVKNADGGITVTSNLISSASFDGKNLSATPLRTSAFCDHYGKRDEFLEYPDIFKREFEFTISEYESDYINEIEALKTNSRIIAVHETFHDGKLKGEFSALNGNICGIVLRCIKPAYDGSGIVVRAFETLGKKVKCKFEIFGAVVESEFTPFEIKTFKIANGKVKEVNLIEK